jgi:septal ring factor EnvC (AmiA/AmiB activator)
MDIVLSLLTSGGIKYIAILALVLVGGTYFYVSYKNYGELQRQLAQYEYNIRQLEQVVKDKEKFIEQLNQINKDKDEAVSLLEKQRTELDNKLKDIESGIDIEIGKGNDKPSSIILKETFRKLSGK